MTKNLSGDSSTEKQNRNEQNHPLREEDYELPTITLKEIRGAIPAHLFRRSLLKSSAYLACSLVAWGMCCYLSTFIDVLLPLPLQLIAWLTCWLFEAIFGVGLWVAGHECGHGAFSNYRTINHTIGFILHSVLLIPFHSFRISHNLHHSGTQNMKTEVIFSPIRRSYLEKSIFWRIPLKGSRICSLLYHVFIFTLSVPLYFFVNFHQPITFNHILPSSPVYKKEHYNLVLLSNAGVLLVITGVGYWAYTTSFGTIAKYYIIPLVATWVGLMFVVILNHTEKFVPHYSPKTWTFVRGALCSVDRNGSWFINVATHRVFDAHVVHHLFPSMPHYNAILATPYVKEKVGKHYFSDNTSFWRAITRVVQECIFVEDEGDILFFKNKL